MWKCVCSFSLLTQSQSAPLMLLKPSVFLLSGLIYSSCVTSFFQTVNTDSFVHQNTSKNQQKLILKLPQSVTNKLHHETYRWPSTTYIHICSSTDAPAGKKLLSVFRRTALRHGVNPLYSQSFFPKDPWMFCLICMNQDLLSANRNIAPEKRGYLFFSFRLREKKQKLYIKWYKEVLQKH